MLTFAIFAFSSLFAVIDPLGCIPFFSGLTARMEARQKRRVLLKSLTVAFVVLAAFIAAGHYLLEAFNITVDAFRIAGGFIFFGIGMDMLQSKPRRWRTGIGSAASRDSVEGGADDDPSITPLAIPLLAGPGSITTVMVLVAEGGGTLLSRGVVVGAVLAILVLTGFILVGADLVLRRLGHTGMKIVEKLMGLLVTVIAVQLVLNGIRPWVRSLLEG
jgi:multiple antibiotic resistance protein